jgi:hypothetical protein
MPYTPPVNNEIYVGGTTEDLFCIERLPQLSNNIVLEVSTSTLSDVSVCGA